ncbi:MAG: DUF6088 family protein [Caulobacterales bacterium]
MSDHSAALKAKIQKQVAEAPPFAVWTPRDFLAFGARDAVDKVLQRMVGAGELRRITRGLYDRPSINSLTRQPMATDPRSVIDAIARRDQIRVLVDGMTAANDLGLTTAVPARIVVHVDARLKPIVLGAQKIVFRPTAASKLYWAGRPAMRVVQALHWLRDVLDREGEADDVRKRLRRLLADPEHGDAIRADLVDGMRTLPAWMQALLRSVIAGEVNPR